MSDDDHHDDENLAGTGREEPATGSPWSRPSVSAPAGAGGDDDRVTWISPGASPAQAPPPPPPPPAAWFPPPESFLDPEEPDSPSRTTGWVRRVVAGALIAFLVAFVGARLLAGPGGPLHAATDPAPGIQFFPERPSGNGPATPAQPVSPEAAAVAAKVRPGVVDINTELAYQQAVASGTGMVLTENGQVLTNAHVIAGATAITARVVDTGETYTATVLGTDRTADIALLQLKDASGLDTVRTGDSSGVQVGDQVVALGNTRGGGGDPSIKSGVVERLGQTIRVPDPVGGSVHLLENLIVTTVALESGDSGGPLANTDGEVIGIDAAAQVDGQFGAGGPRGFSVPIDDALDVVRQILSGQASETVHIGPTAFLGVTLERAGAARGAVVAGVAPDSPADDAGLEAGDTITEVGGQTVDSADALSTAMRAHRPGDKVAVEWTDSSGDDHTATVTLDTGPAA